jgi:tetratricopeptide (TPR) repeat protein
MMSAGLEANIVDFGGDDTITEGWRALDLFTDRVDASRRFCAYLNDDPPPSSVLVFHGDGGNGKSLLLRYLRENLSKRLDADDWEHLRNQSDEECVAQIAAAESAVAVLVARLDFDQSPKDGFGALLELRRDLSGARIRFPLFDFAIVTYLHQSGQLTQEYLRTVFPADDLDFIVEVASLFGEIPGAGLFIKFGDLLDRRFGMPFRRYRQQRGLTEDQVNAILRMDYKSELIQALPNLFASDLNAALHEEHGPDRVVLLFDTHEAFWGRERDIEGDLYFGRDEWLRRLVRTLDRESGAVVVVAGREVPKWSEAPRFPVHDLETIPVGELTDEDADAYLDRAGIAQGALREWLIEDARVGPNLVHPFYLGLGADMALIADRKRETLDESDLALSTRPGNRAQRLIFRLLRYVEAEYRDAVAALSACRSFDRDTYRYLGEQLDFATDRSRFRILTSFSFVRRLDDGGNVRYRVHDLLRRLILDDEREEIRQDAHASLETYYRTRSRDGSELALAEAIYHANRGDWERSVAEWEAVFQEALRHSRFDRCRALLGIRGDLRIESPFWEGLVLTAEATYYKALSRHPETDATYRAAIAAFDRALVQDPDHVEAHIHRGSALARWGGQQATLTQTTDAIASYDSAIAALGQALARAPDNVAANVNRGIALRGRGIALRRHGDLQAALSSYTESIAAFDQALTLAPDHVEAHYNRGISLRRWDSLQTDLSQIAPPQTIYTESIAAFDQALALAPNHVDAHNNRGMANLQIATLRINSANDDKWQTIITHLRAAHLDFAHVVLLAPNNERARGMLERVATNLNQLGEEAG